MTFNVSTKELLRVLKATGAVIQKKNQLPILGCHLFEQRGDIYTITGSSSEHSITMPVAITLQAGDTFSPFCLDAQQVTSLLGSLPEQPLTIDVDPDNLIAVITYQDGRVSVPVERSGEYPHITAITQPTCQFQIESSVLFSAVKAASVCTAWGETLRPQFAAVALDVTEEGVTFVGTDGQLLYKYVYTHGAPFLQTGGADLILVPNTLASALAAPFQGVETIEVVYDRHHLCLKSGDTTFVIRDLEKRYPNYNSIIPKDSPYHLLLPVDQLRAAVKRVQLMASDVSQLVRLSKDDMFLSLTADDYDFSRSATEQLPLADTTDACTLPSGFTIGFKSSSLLRLLDAISTDNVRIELSSPSHPILIKEDASNSVLTELLMPMKVE